MTDKQIVFLLKSLGYNNKLLYWDPILKIIFNEFPKSKVFSSETQSVITGTTFNVEKCLPKISFSIGSIGRSFISPFVLRVISKINPDLLVISEFGFLSLYAVLYKIFNKKTRILLLVESDARILRRQGVERDGLLHRLYRKYICRFSDRILTNNVIGSSYLMQSLGVNKSKIIVGCYLTSGFDDFHLSIPKIKTNISFLYVGRLVKLKGVENLIHSIYLMPEILKNQITLNIVGDGPELGYLKTLVEQLMLIKIVKFHGQQNYEDIRHFYAEADVFVFPTLGDYRALVGFEALSAYLPIIGSIYDGASFETIEENINGFIVDPTDHVQLSSKIKFFVDNKVMLNRFSQESKNKSNSFLVKDAAMRLVDACRVVIGDNSERN